MVKSAFTLLEMLAALVILSVVSATSAVLVRDVRAGLIDTELHRAAIMVLDQWDALGRPGLGPHETTGAWPSSEVWAFKDDQGRHWNVSVTPDELAQSVDQDRPMLEVEVLWAGAALAPETDAPIIRRAVLVPASTGEQP